MESWKYYLLENGNGEPYEIYRLQDDGNAFYGEHVPGSLYLARKSGQWSNDSADVRGLLNASMCGDFDPEDGEITEEEAMDYLARWRAPGGHWPGRE